MTELEKLKKEYEDIQEQCDKDWHEYMGMAEKNIPVEEAWKWYINCPSIKRSEELNKEIRRLEDEIEWSPFDTWDDDVYTLKQFVGMCEEGGFIDYDGFGIYADKKKKMKTNIEVYPSDVTSGKYRTDFTHIVWYNR